VVTVWSVGLRARLCGWSRESATTSLGTGLVLLPCGRVRACRRSRARGLARVSRVPALRLVEGCRTPRKDHVPPPDPPVRSPSLQGVHPHAAAVESGAAEHGVAVSPDRDAHPVRRCGTCTIALEARADWRLACDLTTGAMASTGV
jgi:hypothetical protein